MRSPRLAVLQSIKYRVDGERVQVDVTGSATTGWSMWVDHSSAINTPDSPVKLRVSRFDPPVNGVRARVVVRSGEARLEGCWPAQGPAVRARPCCVRCALA